MSNLIRKQVSHSQLLTDFKCLNKLPRVVRLFFAPHVTSCGTPFAVHLHMVNKTFIYKDDATKA